MLRLMYRVGHGFALELGTAYEGLHFSFCLALRSNSRSCALGPRQSGCGSFLNPLTRPKGRGRKPEGSPTSSQSFIGKPVMPNVRL